MKRSLKKDGKVYVITFDEDGVLDTVECNGKFLVSTNKVVKSILANEDRIFNGFIPKGFEKA